MFRDKTFGVREEQLIHIFNTFVNDKTWMTHHDLQAGYLFKY